VSDSAVEIDEIYFWVDSDRVEARSATKVVDVPGDELKKMLENVCTVLDNVNDGG
jgi:hypothetical protein